MIEGYLDHDQNVYIRTAANGVYHQVTGTRGDELILADRDHWPEGVGFTAAGPIEVVVVLRPGAAAVSFLIEHTPFNRPGTAAEVIQVAEAAGKNPRIIHYQPPQLTTACRVEDLQLSSTLYFRWDELCEEINRAIGAGHRIYGRDAQGACLNVGDAGRTTIQAGWAGTSADFGRDKPLIFVIIP
jgi:hypothetical protein